MQQIEMPNNILKLLDGGIDLVLSGGKMYRGKKWQVNDNLAQSDKRIKALLEDKSLKGKMQRRHSVNKWRLDGRTCVWIE